MFVIRNITCLFVGFILKVDIVALYYLNHFKENYVELFFSHFFAINLKTIAKFTVHVLIRFSVSQINA